MKNALICILLTAIAHTTLAQPQCRTRLFSTEDGVPASVISGIRNSSDNILWLTSWNGLSCYDGYGFTTFGNSDEKSSLLPTNHLSRVESAFNDNLWITSYSGSIYLFDTHSCRYLDITDTDLIAGIKGDSLFRQRKVYSLSNGHTWLTGKGNVHYRIVDSLLINGIQQQGERFEFEGTLKKVVLDEKGREWCLTDKASYVDGEMANERLCEYVFYMNGQTWCFPRENEQVNGCVRTDMDRIAVATDHGLEIVNTRTGATEKTFTVIADKIMLDSKKRLWCLSDNKDDITLIEGNTERNLKSAKSLTTSDVLFVHEDDCGTIWTLTQGGGFCYYDEMRKELVPMELRTGHGIIPRIKNVYGDYQKNLWFVLPHHLALVNFRHNNIRNVQREPKREVRAVMQDSKGCRWMGTTDGELLRNDKVIEKFGRGIYAIFEDRQGAVWIGTRGDGLYRMADGKLQHYANDPSDSYSISNDNIYDIQEDQSGRLWIATFGGGINVYDGERFLHANNRLKTFDLNPFYKVRRIDFGNDGIAFLSTTNGLVTCDSRTSDLTGIQFYASRHEADNQQSLLTSEVMQAYTTRMGITYVATLGGGLQRLVSQSPLANDLDFETVKCEGIQTIMGITEDNGGSLWLMGESRLARLDKTYTEFGANEIDEVVITETRPSHSWLTDSIMIATEGGYITFLPKEMKKRSFQPNVIFSAVGYQDNNGLQPLLNIRELEVDKEHRSFTIYFSALDYTDNKDIRYAYRLDDDEGWTYLQTGVHEVSFNVFPAGSHRLFVKSTNGDGVWADNERVLQIYAEPTFVESWWGRTIIGFILLIVAGLILRNYIRRKKAEIMEEATEQADADKVRFLLKSPEIADEDKLFMDNLSNYLEKNLSDSDLKVDDIAAGLNISRSVFYTRLKSIANMAPSDFLRHVRMQRATEYIVKSDMAFSQIAYKVGFTDPKYFGKCFRKSFGMSPSEYRMTNAK